MLEYINPIKVMVFLTFIYFISNYDKRKKYHVLLIIILTVSLANELISLAFGYYEIPMKFSNSIYTVIHTLLWFILFGIISDRRKVVLFTSVIFTAFIICDFSYIVIPYEFKVYSFIFGAFLYVLLFITDSIARLRKEELTYFLSNNYILISAPLLFFIGFSMLLGFGNKALNKTVITCGITFFNLISYFINTVFYLLLILYIYKEKKYPHGE